MTGRTIKTSTRRGKASRAAILKAVRAVKEETQMIILNKYLIVQSGDGKIDISIIGDGEGMGVVLEKFEKVVDKFYNENF